MTDYSQQEARIIAGLSNDTAAIDLFTSGKDIYLETAKSIVGDGLENNRLRALGKEIVLGLNNGRSAYSIYEGLARLGFGFDGEKPYGTDIQGRVARCADGCGACGQGFMGMMVAIVKLHARNPLLRRGVQLSSF
jgi:hypothetical protein